MQRVFVFISLVLVLAFGVAYRKQPLTIVLKVPPEAHNVHMYSSDGKEMVVDHIVDAATRVNYYTPLIPDMRVPRRIQFMTNSESECNHWSAMELTVEGNPYTLLLEEGRRDAQGGDSLCEYETQYYGW